jgi:hypothetical protein
MSGWMDSFNQAVGFTEDPAESQNRAIDAQTTSTSNQLGEMKRQYNQGRYDFAPFRNLAPQSLATLESAIYGTGQTYADPSYRPVTQEEVDAANKKLFTNAGSPNWWKPSDSPYKMGMFVAPGGELVDSAPMMSANSEKYDLNGLNTRQMDELRNFQPEGTPAYEWKKKRGLEDLRTQLMMAGRGGGTVATNANARFLGDLNAAEYDKGYSRLASRNTEDYNRTFTQKQDYINNLLNLVKTSQGAAGSTGTLGQAAANGSAAAYQNQGNTLANLATKGFETRNAAGQQGLSNLYGGIGAGLNLYATGQKAGWWDGGGGTDWNGSTGTIDNYNANTTYAGDSPGPWAGGN